MMTELAPQDKTGQYQRPKYTFGGTIGSTQFPVEGNGRYHLYLGNPCPVRVAWVFLCGCMLFLRRLTLEESCCLLHYHPLLLCCRLVVSSCEISY